MPDSSGVALLDPDHLRPASITSGIGERILVFRETASTNDLLLHMAAAGEPHGTVIFAESQTAGRGRFHRPWHSAAGLGLWFSFLLRNSLPMAKIEHLTMVAAVSVADSLQITLDLPTSIKPPNDVFLNGRKIAGILIEVRTGPEPFAVVGIGININQSRKDFPESVQETATSLAIESGLRQNREFIAKSVLESLNSWQGILTSDPGALERKYEELISPALQPPRL